MNENTSTKKDLIQELDDSGYFDNLHVYVKYQDLNSDYSLKMGDSQHMSRLYTDGSVYLGPVSYFRPMPHYTVSGATYVIIAEWDTCGYKIDAHIWNDVADDMFGLIGDIGKLLHAISESQSQLDHLSIKTVV